MNLLLNVHPQIVVTCQSFLIIIGIFMQGYDITKKKGPIWAYPHASSRIFRSSIFMLYSDNKQVRPFPSHRVNHNIRPDISVSENGFEHTTSFAYSFSGWKGFYYSKRRPVHWERLQTSAAYDVAGAVEVINDLGLDTLTFLAVTVLIVPTFKLIKASPVRTFGVLSFFFLILLLKM